MLGSEIVVIFVVVMLFFIFLATIFVFIYWHNKEKDRYENTLKTLERQVRNKSLIY